MGGVADANALYLINIGGNDVRDILLSNSDADPLNDLDPGTVITDSVTEIVTQISTLQLAGAQNFLVVGVGDVGAIPEIAPFGPVAQAQATGLSNALNAAIAGALPGSVDFFDTVALFNAVLSDPAAFGLPALIDLDTACQVAAPADFPVCEDYAFLDPVHPTTQVLQILGDELIAAVPEPGTGLLVTFGLVGVALRRRVS